MTGTSFSQQDLRACMLSIAPLELVGMRLLREQHQAIFGCVELPREALIDAVTEIVAYNGRCAAAARNLANLAPIPVLTISIGEFGL